MKKQLLTSCSTLFCGMLFCSLPVNAQTEDAALPVQEIETYFSDVLAEKEPVFTISQTLTADELQSSQQSVWAAWVKVNTNFDEEKLISMKQLGNEPKSKWNLPAKLEPNAVMEYYYGCKGSKPKGGFPLFLYLHGSGTPSNEWSTGLSIALRNDDGPSAYFIPKIPNTGNYYRWYQKSKQWAWEKLLRQSFLTGDINPNRVYFFGISEGGYGSQRLASYYADYLAGAGPMAGGEPLKNAPVENCRNIAFNFRTGADDTGFFRNVLTGYTRDAFEALQKKYPDGFIHHIELIPGYGHHIDYYQTTPWLAKYERNPYPKHVMWENYEMDGKYRKGFYNLYLVEDPRGVFTYRVFYQMDIEDNVINLAVKRTNYRTTETQDGIEMAFKRTYSELNKGKIRIFLNDQLVDMNRPVKVVANGKVLFDGMVQPDLKDMVESCAAFFDPTRVFPASVTIDMTQESLDIDGVQLDTNTAPVEYYDLSGRKVQHPQQGIFITNEGKKIKF